MNYTYNTVLATEGKNEDKTDAIWDLLAAPHIFGVNSAKTQKIVQDQVLK